MRVVVVREIQPVVGVGLSDAPDYKEPFPTHLLFAATGGYRLEIHGNFDFTGTVLAAHPVSIRVNHFKGLRPLSDVSSL
jgi:hypothetical protein